MSDAVLKRPPSRVPKEVLLSAAALILVTIVGAASARISGVGRMHAVAARPIERLALRFEDQDDGSVLVRRAESGAVVYTIAPETNGFMRATLRGLAQERRRSGVGEAKPFLLTHWDDGRMSLDDATTGRHVALDAFGETNAGAFARLFLPPGGRQ